MEKVTGKNDYLHARRDLERIEAWAYSVGCPDVGLMLGLAAEKLMDHNWNIGGEAMPYATRNPNDELRIQLEAFVNKLMPGFPVADCDNCQLLKHIECCYDALQCANDVAGRLLKKLRRRLYGET